MTTAAAREWITTPVTPGLLRGIVEQRAAGDPGLHYLDGRDLCGQADAADLPLPDQLHPDAATHQRIGERFAKLAFTADRPFGASRA